VVIIPKYRKKAIYGKLRQQIGEMLRQLCRQKGIELLEGHAQGDHVHMLLSVPPRYSIAMTVGYLKGKSAVRIHREYGKARGSLLGRSLWSRGYCVSTVGFNEEAVRQYIQDQENREKREEQGGLMFE
jgi:putative transposase